MEAKLIIYRTPDGKVGCLPISKNDWKDFNIKEEYVFWVNSLLGLTDDKTVKVLGLLKLKRFKDVPKPIYLGGSRKYRNRKYDYQSTREVFKNSYKPWTKKSDEKLELMYNEYFGSFYLSSYEAANLLTLHFGRTLKAIICRLQVLELYNE